MTPPADKRIGSVLALAVPGVGTLGFGTSMWLTHAPVAAAIAGGIATVATAVVAIVKIRAGRSPAQVLAESQASVAKKHAALAKKIKNKKDAVLLITLHAFLANNKTDIATLQENIVKLLPPASGPAELPPPGLPSDDYPDASDDPSTKFIDDQLRRFVGDQPDSNAETLTIAIAQRRPAQTRPGRLHPATTRPARLPHRRARPRRLAAALGPKADVDRIDQTV